MKEVDDKYYERADAHIRLSNEQITEEVGHGKVSASFMFGAARFNAHLTATSWNTKKEFSDGKDEAIKYFVSDDNEKGMLYQFIYTGMKAITKGPAKGKMSHRFEILRDTENTIEIAQDVAPEEEDLSF